MNKHIDQSELGKIVAEQRGIDQKTANAFIQQLFKNIEKKLITDSSVKIDELGLFRIIKSGSTNRILFLGSTTNNNRENKTDGVSSLAISNRTTTASVDRPITERSSRRNTNTSPSAETSVNITGRSAENSSSGIHSENRNSESNSIQENEDNNRTNRPSYSGTEAQVRSMNDINNQGFSTPQRNKMPIYIGVGLLMTLIIGTFIYNSVSPSSQQLNSSTTYGDSNSSAPTRTTRFAEVTNTDTENLSCIIIVDSSISLKDLAQLYYGNNLFWPYIYKANRNITDNSFVIPSNSIVKIPRITVDLVDYSTGILNGKVKALGDEILKEAGVTGK